MTSTLEIKERFEDLQRQYREYLPKVDPALADDLLLRQLENPAADMIYMVEVFTREGLDPEAGRQYIMSKTGMSPAIYDNGTHYVTNQKLTLEVLKEISDLDDVIEVTGDYTGRIGAYGASHEHRERRVPEHAEGEPSHGRAGEEKSSRRGGGRALAAYTAMGIVGAIALAGFVISGGVAPNANAPVPTLSEPGVLHGYVAGPGGLPAVGATVVAAEQSSGYTANGFVSVTGQYYLDLPAGQYVVMAAFPDGTNKVVSGLAVERGTSQQLDISY
jgi:hypothetical protein